MANPAVNDIIEMTVNQRKDGQSLQNVFHYRCTVTPSSGTERANLFSLIQFLWDVDTGFLEPLLTVCMPDDWILQSVRAQVVAPARHSYAEQLLVDNGDLSANLLDTPNLAWVIIKQSELAGRRGRGTTHFLVPTNDWITDGELNTTNAGNRADLANALDDHIVVPSGGEYDPVLYHPGFSPNYSTITHTTIKSEIRTMRRRTVGRGI
jgi:hypothetical protein